MSQNKMTIAVARLRIHVIRKGLGRHPIFDGDNGDAGDAAGERLVLLDRLVALKVAVQIANVTHTLEFNGRRMTLYEAVVRKAEMKAESRGIAGEGIGAIIARRRWTRLRKDIGELSRLLDEASNRYHIDFC